MTTQPQPEALLPLPEAEAWVISLDCDMRGFMDAKAWKEDEFTTPLFTADQMRAYATEHAAKLHAECEALRADAERWRFARDNIVAFYETTGHWRLYMLDGTIVYEGTASSYQGAIDAARAAKEQA